jgi:hypothetical protein
MYGIEVTFNDMSSVLIFITTYQLVQKLLRGQTDGQTGNLINLTFLFRESRLKIMHLYEHLHCVFGFAIFAETLIKIRRGSSPKAEFLH